MKAVEKVVLVTGGTSGIGQATAELFAEQRWKVVISGRRQDRGDSVVAEIKSRGGEATFIKSNVSSEDQVKALVAKVVELYGRLDGAVNNAAVAENAVPFADTSSEAFVNMWQVNVMGVYWCMQQEILAMRKSGGGAIVNLSSIGGINGVPMTSTYCATKHAVIGLTKSAALDHATENIRINAICPGGVKTDIISYAIDSGAYPLDKIVEMFPIKRLGSTRDIAEGIKFLVDNQFCVGSILSVDGGFHAK